MAIAFVNSTGATIATAASTWSLALPLVTAGSAVCIGIGVGTSGTTVSTVTDNSGATWLKAVARATPRPAAGAELWYATNVAATSTRVSVTLSGSDSGSIASACFTGFSTGNPLGPTASSAITANSTLHGAANIATPLTSGVAVAFSRLTASSLGTVTPGASYTAWISTGTCVRTLGEYWIQTTPTVTDGLYNTNSNAQHAAVIAYFYDTTPVGKMQTNRMSWLGVQ
jgi:hypothetical protein